jgi:hypothetical protein
MRQRIKIMTFPHGIDTPDMADDTKQHMWNVHADRMCEDGWGIVVLIKFTKQIV